MPVRPTERELAAQVGATTALELADLHRDDPSEYEIWMDAAARANERTRQSMSDRGVAMFTRTRSVT